jgi:O-succinylhomoserine sulfhydrylase
MGLLKSGDHVVSSSSIFGATVQLFTTVLGKFGIETTFVYGGDPAAWARAVRPTTRLLFLETPSNPLTEVADIAALAGVARAGACSCGQLLLHPGRIHPRPSIWTTGRVLGGAVVGRRELVMDGVFPFLRTAGPSLSPFNAWVLLKGLETLRIRMDAQSQRALELARWVEAHPRVDRVYYPGLASHPQHALAMRQQTAGGAIVSFDVRGGREAAWRVIDATRLISITANLGDTKSTITHPATTTHGRISAAARAAAGIGDGLVRVAVGLESVEDLKADLARGLDA